MFVKTVTYVTLNRGLYMDGHSSFPTCLEKGGSEVMLCCMHCNLSPLDAPNVRTLILHVSRENFGNS